MTTKRFPIYLDMINLILLYFLIMSFDMTLSSGMRFVIRPSEYIGMGLVVFVSYLIREKINRMYLYVILHVVMIALCILPPLDVMCKVKLVFVAILFFIFDIYNWFNGVESTPDIYWGTGFIVLLAFFLSTGEFEFGYSKTIFNMGIMFAALLLVRMLIANFYELSRSGQLTEDMPVRELFRNNALIATGIIILAVLLMAFVRSDPLIRKINEIIYRLLKKFWDFISYYVTSDEGSMSQNRQRQVMPDLPEMGDSIWAQLLQIFEALMTVLIAVLIIYFIIKCVIGIIGMMSGNRTKRIRSHRSYRVKNEVRERLTRADTKEDKRRGFFKTNAEKVRHIYKKGLLSYKHKGADVRETKTPDENRKEVLDYKGHDITAATKIYEKVRFCVGYEATKQDVSDIKAGFRS